MAVEYGKTLELGSYIADLSQPLGRGTYGEVFLGRHREFAEKVAIKKIKHTSEGDYTNSVMGKRAEREIENALWVNGHPNIVSFLDYFDDGTSFWLTMEYCPHGDLESYLLKNHCLMDMNAKVGIMNQCVQGIAFMHSFEPPFVHRNIRPKNFLVTGDSSTEIIVKASDFGLAKLLENSHNEHGMSSCTASILMNSCVESMAFMAPEMFKGNEERHYSSAVDIFSMGLLLQVLLMFSSNNKVMVPQLAGPRKDVYSVGQVYQQAKDCDSDIPELVHDHPDDSTVVKKLKMIIRSMTRLKPRDRPKLSSVGNKLESIIKLLDVADNVTEEPVCGPREHTSMTKESGARQQRSDPPAEKINYKSGSPPATPCPVAKPRLGPKSNIIGGAVKPVGATGCDSNDQLRSAKPKNGQEKPSAEKMEDCVKQPNIKAEGYSARGARQHESNPPPKKVNYKAGKQQTKCYPEAKPRGGPKPNDLGGAVEPVGAGSYDPDDQTVATKPKNGRGKLDAEKLADLERKPNARSKDCSAKAARHQRPNPPSNNVNYKAGPHPAKRYPVGNSSEAPKSNVSARAVEPVGFDSVDLLPSAKPKNGQGKKKDLKKKPNVTSKISRARGGAQQTEEERRDMFDVTNIHDFKNLKDIIAKLNPGQD